MKRNLLSKLMTAAFMVLLASCSKQHLTAPDAGPVPVPGAATTLNEKMLVQTSMDYDNTTLEYYPDHKLKSWGYSGHHYEFTYSGNTVTDVYSYNNKKFAVYLFTLNNKGYIDNYTYTQYDNNGNPTGQVSSAQYFYNNKWQLIKQTYSTGGHSDLVYDANGNLSEYHAFNTSDVEYWVSKYEYYADKACKPVSYGQLNSNGFGGFQPQLAKNLLKRQVAIDMPGNVKNFDASFTYEIDAAGFVTKGKYVDVVSGNTREWTNVYQ